MEKARYPVRGGLERCVEFQSFVLQGRHPSSKIVICQVTQNVPGDILGKFLVDYISVGR